MPDLNNGAPVENTLIQICKEVTGQNGELDGRQPLARILKLKKEPLNWDPFIAKCKKRLPTDMDQDIIDEERTPTCIQIMYDLRNK